MTKYKIVCEIGEREHTFDFANNLWLAQGALGFNGCLGIQQPRLNTKDYAEAEAQFYCLRDTMVVKTIVELLRIEESIVVAFDLR